MPAFQLISTNSSAFFVYFLHIITTPMAAVVIHLSLGSTLRCETKFFAPFSHLVWKLTNSFETRATI